MDFTISSASNLNNESSSEPPVNHLSSYTTNSSNNNSLSSLSNRSISNRYYTLANISPSSSFYFPGDDHSVLPHNRQNSSQLSNPSHQIRNSMHHNSRAISYLLNNQHNNVDIEEHLGAQGLVELSRVSSSPIEGNSVSAIGASYEIFPGQSFRATKGSDKALVNRSLTCQGNFSILELEEDRKITSQYRECLSPQALNLDDLPYNWQASKSTVKERISSIFNKNAMADVYFIVGRSPNIQRIPGHQFVLAISSAVFDAMFYGPLSAKKVKKSPIVSSGDDSAETEGDNNQMVEMKLQSLSPILEISVPDVEPVAFLALLRFIYTDDVHIDPDTVMTTLYAAKKYSIPSLEKSCVDYLRRNLCSENAFMLLTQARLFNEVQLAHQCLDVIDKNTSEALSADGFLDIDLDTLCSVLDRDTLGIREVKLFQATMKWGQSQLRKRESASSMMVGTEETIDPDQKNQSVVPSNISDISSEQLRIVLGPALHLIRFPLMSIDDFASTVAQLRILSDRELVDMFLYYLTNPKPLIPYKDTPRCCLTGKEQVVNRYPVVEQRWGYSGTSDRIRFMVDRKIFVVGFGLYGSAQGPAEYQVIVEILQQDSGGVLASNYLTFKCDGSNSTFRVRFKEPVEILPNVSYIACATLKGPDSYYGSIGYQKVIHESATHGKVSFQFNYAAGNNNGTSVEDGQIPEIVFYM